MLHHPLVSPFLSFLPFWYARVRWLRVHLVLSFQQFLHLILLPSRLLIFLSRLLFLLAQTDWYYATNATNIPMCMLEMTQLVRAMSADAVQNGCTAECFRPEPAHLIDWFPAQILSKMDGVLNALGQNPHAGSYSSIVHCDGIQVQVNSEDSEERRAGNKSHCSSFSSRKLSDSSRQTAHQTHTHTRNTRHTHTNTPQQLAYVSDSD